MKIRIIALGKIRDKWLKEGIASYEKLLRRFAKLEIIEIEDLPDSYPLDKLKAIEGEKVLGKLGAKDYCIALDLAGERMDSLGFARALEESLELGGSNITFIIAGSNGYDPALLRRANRRISFGDLTFPHQLVRLFLVEQIFRAFKINKAERYHK